MTAAVCIFAAAVCKLFDSSSKEYSVLIKTAVAAAVMAVAVEGIIPVISRLEELYSRTGGSGEYFDILIKSMGICYLTQLAADICRDSGEGSLAVQTETVGKTALLIVSLPLFEAAAELAQKMIS